MEFYLKDRETFKKYIETIQVLPSADEMAIDAFDSSSLFDLYGLLTQIKDNRQISSAKQELLAQKLANNFPEELVSLLHFPVNQSVLSVFEEYIKGTFISYITNLKDLTPEEQEELEKLKIIMAKKQPQIFLKFIKQEKNATEFKLEKDYIEKNFRGVLDDYSKHIEETQNNEDIQSASYIVAKNKFPKIRISTSGRLKSMKSVKDNIDKEMKKALEKVMPSDLEKGISYNDLSNTFNLSKISDDFYGFLVYIKGIDDTFHLNESMKNTEAGKLFLAYRNQKKENVTYFQSLSDFLADPSSLIAFSQEDYLQMQIELLNKLQYLTFQECSQEYSGPLFEPQDSNDPGTSFSKLLASSLNEYTTLLEQDGFKQQLTDSEHIQYQEKLFDLYQEFDKRIHDKYEFEALKLLIPQILQDKNYMNENILRDQLGIKVISTKATIKKNGFCALYAILELPDSRKIEIQFLTHHKYINSKIGSSSHSFLTNKQLDISQFFELDDNYKGTKNYETLLNNAIHILDVTPVAQKNRLLSTPMESLTNDQQQLRKQIEFAEKNLKIKKYFPEIPITTADGSQRPCTIEEYLPIFAEYHSPKLVAVTSASSRVNKNTAFVNIKTAVDNFKEVLLKSDETSCLADKLLDCYEIILEEHPVPSTNTSSKKIEEILQNNAIPKMVRDEIMIQLTQFLQTNDRTSYTNCIADIKKRIDKKNKEEIER